MLKNKNIIVLIGFWLTLFCPAMAGNTFVINLVILEGSGQVICNGTNIPNYGGIEVNEGSSLNISFVPRDGYKIKSVIVRYSDESQVDVTSQIKNNQYTIKNVADDIFFYVAFEPFSLTITTSGNGKVSYYHYNSGTPNYSIRNETATVIYDPSKPFTFKFIPDKGYHIAFVKENNIDVTANVSDGQYTIENINADTHIEVAFEPDPSPTYILSITASGYGSATYNGTTSRNQTRTFTVNEGTSATVSFSPDNGYRIASVKKNSTDVTSKVQNNQYTVSNITANTTVSVSFEAIPQTTYTLSITASGYGSATYNGTSARNQTRTFTVNEGASATVSFSPDNGYHIASVKVNNADVTGASVTSNRYTISNITANTTVAVTFEQIPVTTHTLSIQSGSGGYVSYDGTIISNTTKSFSVASGSSATISITPHSGYRLSELSVNGTDITVQVSNNQYTISSITSDTYVIATFTKDDEPSGSVTKTVEGSTVTFLVDGAIEGEKVTVDLNEQGWASGKAVDPATITLTDGTKITFDKGEGDTAPAFWDTTKGVRIYANNTITISGKAVAKVVLYCDSFNGIGYVGNSTLYGSADGTTFVICNEYSDNKGGNQLRVQKIEITYAVTDIEPINVSISASGNGNVFYNGTTIRNESKSFSLYKGASATISFTPDNGYRIGSVKVNNTDVTANVTNNQYTVNNILTNTSISVTFADIEYDNLSNNGVNYRVVSNPNKTVNVASGSYGYWLTVPASFTANGFEWSVTGIDNDVLSNNPQLAAVIWNPSVQFTASVTNPNFLLYVTSSQYAPSAIKNVVVGNTANSITLTDASSGNNFYCPREFTARSISYSHSYGMTTGINEARGWESISLPFDVEAITHSSKGTLVPFTNWQEGGSTKPFWLYQLGSSGFAEASSIKANTPYIISMPNNAEYLDEYRVSGTITFSSTDVTVKSSESLQNGTYGDRTFIPNFINQDANSGFYVLNAVNNYSANSSGYAEGSRFVRNLRAIHPFEAYIASANNAKESFPIFEDEATWIRSLSPIPSPEGKGGIYDLSGRRIQVNKVTEYQSDQFPALQGGARGRLQKGVYIVNRKKIVIR